MNETHDDRRVTDYVFGELPPEQLAAFEQELAQSPQLRQEVDAIRDAVAALQSEFESRSPAVSPAQRRVVEDAIEQRAKWQVSAVAPQATHGSDHARSRFAVAGVLAASVLIAAGLTFPLWRSQTPTEISMHSTSNRPSKPDATKASRAPDDQSNGIRESALGRGQDALAIDRQGVAFNEGLEVEEENLSSMLPSLDAIESASRMSARGSQSANQPDSSDPFSDVRELEESLGVPGGGLPGDPLAEPAAVLGDIRDGEVRDGDRDYLFAADEDAREYFGRAGKALRSDAQAGGMGGGSGKMSGLESQSDGASALDGLATGESKVLADDIAPSAQPSQWSLNLETEADSIAAVTGMQSMMGGMIETEMEMDAEQMDDMMMELEPMQMGMNFGMQMSGDMPLDVAGNAVRGNAVRDGDIREGGVRQRAKQQAIDATADRYARINDNPFVDVGQAPLSTFSIDVDTASYSKIRSLLQSNVLPRPDAVRIEELLNYFDYDYPAPQDSHPFAAVMEIASCPWNAEHRLARIGIQAREIETQRPSSNLVFLLDVSGSMDDPAKLPLVVEGMKLLTNQLNENDKVAIVVYAGAAGMVLDATRGDKKQAITAALDRLSAGGSTNGGQGIVLAYQIARDHFIRGGTNRVILCSDGDFNVGVTGTEELIRIAKENAGSNIFLSVLGFGTGNHNDEMMERLSNEGNGNYAFIDSKREAEKVFVEELGSTLVTVAKDVKIQIEFNPKQVSQYRLIGYENRRLKDADFANDKKDAGEIGAGHTVTALYELVPAESSADAVPSKKRLRYQEPTVLSERGDSNETLTLNLRYKQPDGETSTLIEIPVEDSGKRFLQTDRDFRFAAAVAGFGMLLRNSPHRGDLSLEEVHTMAIDGAKGDDFGYRNEFVELVKQARTLRGE